MTLQSRVKRTSVQNSAIQNNCSVMLAYFFILFLFTDEKVFTVTTLKNPQKDRQYIRPSVNQEERRRVKTPAHTINVQSLTTSACESWNYTRLILAINHWAKVSKAPFTRYNRLFDNRLYRVYSRLSNRLYNPVWQPVERTVAVRSTRLSNRLSIRFDNRLYRVNGV